MVVSEFPGLASDVLRRRTEYGTLHGHASVELIVVAGGEETLDRKSEQHDSPLFAVDVPARYGILGVRERGGPDLETHLLQFRPGATQEFDGRADGDVEPIDPTVQRWQWRADDGASSDAPVAAVPCTATGRCGGRSTAGHAQSLGAAARHPSGVGEEP